MSYCLCHWHWLCWPSVCRKITLLRFSTWFSCLPNSATWFSWPTFSVLRFPRIWFLFLLCLILPTPLDHNSSFPGFLQYVCIGFSKSPAPWPGLSKSPLSLASSACARLPETGFGVVTGSSVQPCYLFPGICISLSNRHNPYIWDKILPYFWPLFL
jgi:hypothetical protein